MSNQQGDGEGMEFGEIVNYVIMEQIFSIDLPEVKEFRVTAYD